MVKFYKISFWIFFIVAFPLAAFSSESVFKKFLESNSKFFQKSSSKTIDPIIEKLLKIDFDRSDEFLSNWKEKKLWFRKKDGLIISVTKVDKKTFNIFDWVTGKDLGLVEKKQIKQIKPNSGVRAKISSALIQFQLIDNNPEIRSKTLDALARNLSERFREPLALAIRNETNDDIKTRMHRLQRLIGVKYEKNTDRRIELIRSFSSDLGIDIRGVLNQINISSLKANKMLPENTNIRKILIPEPGEIISTEYEVKGNKESINGKFSDLDAYKFLVRLGLALEPITQQYIKDFLIKKIEEGIVDNKKTLRLNTNEGRIELFKTLDKKNLSEGITKSEMIDLVKKYKFYYEYHEPSEKVTSAVSATLNSINQRVAIYQFIDLVLDGLSLASIYFLAAIGLAITFGVMRVINMAHGEFIMLGAYTGYVIQLFISNYTLSLLLAIPMAFCVTFLVGIMMESLVIRKLYKRPLETLLATFGISIALQQLAKIVFGTQARPLTSPFWLDGTLAINEIVSISWIRVAIFALSIIFSFILLFILHKTRFGLETRAVTQNPNMAASMGINPTRINMLTFGLGSGIAGVAGVAIGLYAKVTSELGSDYIVQSFMTVVVGGVGSIWGTLAGATLIGFLQKGIEWFNPSNTLAAQTFMIIFIIIFIQFRPRGIIAIKGRAAGD